MLFFRKSLSGQIRDKQFVTNNGAAAPIVTTNS